LPFSDQRMQNLKRRSFRHVSTCRFRLYPFQVGFNESYGYLRPWIYDCNVAFRGHVGNDPSPQEAYSQQPLSVLDSGSSYRNWIHRSSLKSTGSGCRSQFSRFGNNESSRVRGTCSGEQVLTFSPRQLGSYVVSRYYAAQSPPLKQNLNPRLRFS
jgi:hypothetical protein